MDAATTNYLIQLNNLPTQIRNMRVAQHARVTAWVNTARAVGYEEWKIIEYVLKPWNAWDQAVANLADITIPLEIMRLQRDPAAPIGDINAFKPPAPPALPPTPTGTGSPPAGGSVVTIPPNDSGSTTQPPAGGSVTIPPTIGGISTKTLAIGAGVGLVVLLLLSGSPNRRG